MAYDSRLLFDEVRKSLQGRPRIHLTQLAAQLKIDRHTVERAVRQETGKSFRVLQAEVTLDRAIELLAAVPPRSVKEISFALGYTSPAAMSQFIKRACGKSPTQLRSTRDRAK